MRASLAVLVSITALIACGDDAVGPEGPDPIDLAIRLDQLPGTRATEWIPPMGFDAPDGYRFFDLHVTLPVDHARPEAGTFELYGALISHDPAAPLVVHVGGYEAGWKRYATEPTQIVGGNQLSLEYRFYGGSRPATIPWSLLRVRQAAADEHVVLETLSAIYTGRRIATGGSKGGENALFHHKFYPDDYDGIVAYVAPIITDFPDLRYAGILDRIGEETCRARLRGLGRVALARQGMLASRSLEQASFGVAGVEQAVETAIVELEFGFWMTQTVDDCVRVPDPATVTDDQLWAFMDEISSPIAYGDEALASYGTQYLYQDHVELGYPVWMHAHLDDLLRFSYEDWSPYLPPGEPITYDPTEARALAAWIENEAENILIIQGEWDPWAAGAPVVGAGRDAYQYWVPRGSHWSAGIDTLPEAERALAISHVRRWAGVTERSARLAIPAPLAPMASRGPDDPRLRR